MKSDSISASMADWGNRFTYSGAAVTVLGWLKNIDLVTVIGCTVAIGGFLVNLYFKRRDDRRAEEAHRLDMAERKARLERWRQGHDDE